MAKFEALPKIELEIILRLNESEARFLEGMSGFDPKAILEALRSCVGSHYTEGSDGPRGFFTLMESCKRDLPSALDRIAQARKVFNGTHVASNKAER